MGTPRDRCHSRQFPTDARRSHPAHRGAGQARLILRAHAEQTPPFALPEADGNRARAEEHASNVADEQCNNRISSRRFFRCAFFAAQRFYLPSEADFPPRDSASRISGNLFASMIRRSRRTARALRLWSHVRITRRTATTEISSSSTLLRTPSACSRIIGAV